MTRDALKASRLRYPALAAVAVVAVLAVAWAMHASARPPAEMLEASSSEAPGVSGSGTASAPARQNDVAPTRAAVAHPAPSQITAERPQLVTLVSGTTVRVRVSATDTTGELAIPANINQAGWWDGGTKLGDPFGAIVVAAHVDSFTQGLGRFAELLSMHPGDRIKVHSADLAQTFTVVSAHLVPKNLITSTSDAFSAHGQSRLVLITCGGAYTPAGGYQSNMVVVATATGKLTSHR